MAGSADDLSALAWVQDELRRSLETANKALRRYVKEAAALAGSDVDVVDPSVLRSARMHLHQGVGALELVGLPIPARLLRAAEAAVLRLSIRPADLDASAVATIEQAAFALLDFLARLLGGKPVSPLALFPQYAAVQQLAGADRIHPADLWSHEWQWQTLPEEPGLVPRPADDAARGLMEGLVLALMRAPDAMTAARMSQLCAELGASSAGHGAALWRLAAGFFQAQAAGLLSADVHVKRVASRLMARLRAMVRGASAPLAEPSERLAQDMLFFCAHARAPAPGAMLPRLVAVRRAWGLDVDGSAGLQAAGTDYQSVRLGRFDPNLLVQSRKRAAAAKEAWSGVAGGDLLRLPALSESFALLGESLQRLYPSGEALAMALLITAADIVGAEQAPPATLAMEVATALLYIEASLEDGELDHPEMAARVKHLAARIHQVRGGAEPQMLESWMEELYRRVADRQTMGSVVHELRTQLSEVEKQIDQYFRDPSQRTLLVSVPAQLGAMRGVLSVLGLDQASQAVLHMRDEVDALAQTEVDPQRAVQTGTFDRLADNLGALSFLIDMLSVQPALAKSLFSFDPASGSLRARVLQSERVSAFAAFDEQPLAPAVPAVPDAPEPEPMPATPPAAATPVLSGLEDDPEMREVFLEEAHEVLHNAREGLRRLGEWPEDANALTTVRRAFHTLKGSARMVGLADFGEAAWHGEQLYNLRLAGNARAEPALQQFTAETLDYLGSWVAAVEGGRSEGHASTPVALAAAALRDGRARIALALPSTQIMALADAARVETVAPVMPEPVLERVDEPVPKPMPEPVLEPVLESPPETAPDFALEPPASTLQARVPDLPSAADLDLGVTWPPIDQQADEAPITPVADPFELVFELAPASAAVAETAAPVEIVAEPELAFELDLGEFDEPAPVLPVEIDAVVDLPPDLLHDQPLTVAETAPLPEGAAVELEFDSEDMARVFEQPAQPFVDLGIGALAEPPVATPVEEPVLVTESFIEPAPEPVVEALAEPEPERTEDEAQRIIGPLSIPLPLFNIFLNESDEQSRRLCTELAEWAMESHRLAPESSSALAHSLAGNSATVGHADLSALARALEHSLLRSRAVGPGDAEQAALFVEAAEEIRRLLHQFAAGFLKVVPAELLQRLSELERRLSQMPVKSAPAAFAEDDDGFDVDDALDAELFPIFEDEAAELLPQLLTRLADWVRQPADRGAPAACMRTLHTFKGGARLAGAMRLGEMAHRLESAIERLESADRLQATDLEPLLALGDRIAGAFDTLRAAPVAAVAQPVEVVGAVEPAQQAEPLVDVASVGDPAVAEAAPVQDLEATVVLTETMATPVPAAPVIDWSRFMVAPAAGFAAKPEAVTAAGGVVRVRAALLDRLVNQAGEVSITRARLEAGTKQLQSALGDLSDNLERLRRQLRDIEVQAETQIGARLEAAKAASLAFDPLEMDRFTRFQELTRFMAESVNDVATVQRGLQRSLQSTEDELAAQARLTRELQEDLLRTRMVEFESSAERLYRVVRQAAKESGRQVRLDIVGGAIEVDRGVIERMVGPFEHLLRNAVVHGIEPPEQRRAAGKDPVGSISVTVSQEGNEVGVEFRDDGGGLDYARIRARGLARGLLAPDAAADDAALAQLIFLPGFSTAEGVTELAGRGIGMDVVRAEVNAMGGRIEIESQPGAGTPGTRIRLLLPLTTAVTQVVMLRAGSLTAAVPATLVEVVRRSSLAEVKQGYSGAGFTYDGQALPFFWLGALLQAGGHGGGTARSETVVVIRSAAQRVALHVDEVLGNQEVVVKNLGPQLSRMPGLAGITLLPSGAVAPIYNPVALAVVYGEQARERMRRPHTIDTVADAAPRAPLVLVVDDSLTVRRVTQRLLLREGYRVVLAKDGLEALERLAEERPSVLLSDIEMPRMDGFDLLRNVRADRRLAGLPVVMITSRTAQKHRDHAAALGADHYLGKPFAEEELLALVARHIGADIRL